MSRVVHLFVADPTAEDGVRELGPLNELWVAQLEHGIEVDYRPGGNIEFYPWGHVIRVEWRPAA